jgi:anti-anti-sigma factor
VPVTQAGQTKVSCRVRTEERGGHLRVIPEGELDLACRDAFAADVLPRARKLHAGEITVDLTDVSFVDFRGLDMLLELNLAARRNGQVTLINAPPSLRKLLEHTKTSVVFALVIVLN